MEDLIMKKLISLFPLFLFCMFINAKELNTSWVETDEGKMDCKKIRVGSANAKVTLENGEKRIIPIVQIKSYTMNGKVFTRLPLYESGKPTGQLVFMELVKNCYDFDLYRYEYINTNLNGKVISYFLYNGDKLHLALDEKSFSNISRHFGIANTSK